MKFLLLLLASVLSTQASFLNVTLYYEALCPYSKAFISTQLYPTFQEIGEYLNIDFVPFGAAHVSADDDGNLNFTCQHGPDECHGNEVHACVLALNPGYSVDFIACSMAAENPGADEYLQQCAADDNISWDSIEDCLSSGLGDRLFEYNGVRTAAANISYVPYIFLNGVHDETLEDASLADFFATACLYLDGEPTKCASHN